MRRFADQNDLRFPGHLDDWIGIINEVYYPTVDQPNTRDFEFLISDGKEFCHEEKRDLDNRIDYPERGCLFLSPDKFRAQRSLSDHQTGAG